MEILTISAVRQKINEALKDKDNPLAVNAVLKDWAESIKQKHAEMCRVKGDILFGFQCADIISNSEIK